MSKARPLWPASAAQAADWPRLAEAWGSLSQPVRKLSSFSDRTDPLAPGNRKGSLPSIRGGRGAGGRGGDRATSAPQDGPDLSVGAAAAAATAPPQAADG
eukprot:scaffold5055_cov58-Phaeocystis_antarctica.AAC.7